MADEDILNDFVIESFDLLDTVEPKLIALQHSCEKTGNLDSESINSVFRLFHSMKGGAGFLDLTNITSLTHSAENLLDLIREGKALFNQHNIQVLFRSLDLLRKMLGQVMKKHHDNGFETLVAELVRELDTVIEVENGKNNACVKQVSPVETETSLPSIEVTQDMLEAFAQESEELVNTFEENLKKIVNSKNSDRLVDMNSVSQAYRAIHSLKGNCGFMQIVDLGKLTEKIEQTLDLVKSGVVTAYSALVSLLLSLGNLMRGCISDIVKGGKGDIQNIDSLLAQISQQISTSSETSAQTTKDNNAKQVDSLPNVKPPQEKSKSKEKKSRSGGEEGGKNFEGSVARQDIRVDLKKLDSLINLVGELVIAEAMVTRHPSIIANMDEGVERAIHQLRRVSRDLQSVAMAVRMIPLASTFQKMMRLAYDLSAKSGKKVDLELIGGDTEVDKTVIEQINDPLVHIVRNALDHGLETVAERQAVGKPDVGHVSIEGRHESGEVWIIIKDDGRGLSRDKILQKGIERGLVQGDGKDLTDNQVFKLIFEPGFSTAEKVTEVSGRGVGMDVVKRDIEKLKGRVDITSTFGHGATFTLRLPLTLAIIDGMLVRVAENCYTVPILAIKESVRPTENDITVTPDGTEVVRLRNDFIPVIRLNEVLQRECTHTKIEDGILVIAETDKSTVGLLVDEILGQQETVVKGLPNYISQARGISGCTILGDGRVSLIVDVSTLISQVNSM